MQCRVATSCKMSSEDIDRLYRVPNQELAHLHVEADVLRVEVAVFIIASV